MVLIGSWVVACRTCCCCSSRAPLPGLTEDLLFVVFLWCVRATHGLPCRDPLGCTHIQGDVTTKRQPLCGCLRVLGQVVVCRCDDRGRGLVMWTSVDRAHILHTSSAREVCFFSARKAFLDQLMFARSIARACASSTAHLRIQVHLHDRERVFIGICGVSRRCSGPVRPDSSCSRAPSTRRRLVFLVHVIHVLVHFLSMSCNSALLSYRFVLELYLCVDVTHHDSVILRGFSCGTDVSWLCYVLLSIIRIVRLV